MFDPYSSAGDPYYRTAPATSLTTSWSRSIGVRARARRRRPGKALGKLLVAAVVGFLALGVFVTMSSCR